MKKLLFILLLALPFKIYAVEGDNAICFAPSTVGTLDETTQIIVPTTTPADSHIAMCSTATGGADFLLSAIAYDIQTALEPGRQSRLCSKFSTFIPADVPQMWCAIKGKMITGEESAISNIFGPFQLVSSEIPTDAATVVLTDPANIRTSRVP